MTALRMLPPGQQGVVAGLVAVAIWGAYLALAQNGVAGGLTASDLAAVRYIPAGLVMLPWLLRHQPRQLAGIGWRRSAALTLFAGPLFILLGVGGYAFAPLSHGAVLQPAAVTLVTVAAAALVFHERLQPVRLVGIAILFAGMMVIADPAAVIAGVSGQAALGDGMFLAAGLCWAGFATVSRLWRVPPLAGTAVVAVLSAVIWTPVFLSGDGVARLAELPLSTLLLQIGVQGILSGVVAVLAFSTAIARLGPARAAVFPALVPASAIVMGFVLVGEVPTERDITGLALVSLGLLLPAGWGRLSLGGRLLLPEQAALPVRARKR